jgi:hypothetical protein
MLPAIPYLQGADEDDGDIAGLLVGFQVLANRVSIHLRHHDVEQNQVGGVVRTASNASRPLFAV